MAKPQTRKVKVHLGPRCGLYYKTKTGKMRSVPKGPLRQHMGLWSRYCKHQTRGKSPAEKRKIINQEYNQNKDFYVTEVYNPRTRRWVLDKRT